MFHRCSLWAASDKDDPPYFERCMLCSQRNFCGCHLFKLHQTDREIPAEEPVFRKGRYADHIHNVYRLYDLHVLYHEAFHRQGVHQGWIYKGKHYKRFQWKRFEHAEDRWDTWEGHRRDKGYDTGWQRIYLHRRQQGFLLQDRKELKPSWRQIRVPEIGQSAHRVFLAMQWLHTLWRFSADLGLESHVGGRKEQSGQAGDTVPHTTKRRQRPNRHHRSVKAVFQEQDNIWWYRFSVICKLDSFDSRKEFTALWKGVYGSAYRWSYRSSEQKIFLWKTEIRMRASGEGFTFPCYNEHRWFQTLQSALRKYRRRQGP